MKKLYKAMYILIMIFMLLISNKAYAIDIFSEGKTFINYGLSLTDENISYKDVFTGQWMNKATGIGKSVAKSDLMQIIDTLWAIGLLVIFISTVVLGIKYMLVLPAERSRIKQATTPHIIGVIIIFGAVTIWKLVITVLDGSIM